MRLALVMLALLAALITGATMVQADPLIQPMCSGSVINKCYGEG